ncbi:fumarylacetoacetate hydrolase family protein [Allocatelliglobosispora scoriae]|uniref:fumarylacetoacetate hydrolase family protein n=1 Tax=Allocatelliglobosispora scoriae TaxID=643052 RepID=UPI0028AC4C69|nr:fumarylacetoacetate hydrolase family protein [Allocatelliglobosispora scoriae]
MDHLPYGVFRTPGREPRCAARFGDHLIDLYAAESAGAVEAGGTLRARSLNDLMSAGPDVWSSVRRQLLNRPPLDHLVPLSEVELLLPFEVADYVDFYSSEHHAGNVGQIFRPGQPPLLPNWKQLPIGYHGRAGTVVVSGTPVVRPGGLLGAGVVGPSQRLDIEAEIGFVVGIDSTLGRPVPIEEFHRAVFGVVVVNDWSARDIQAFEYQPLGPFLGKSFATSVSAWVTPLEALASAWTPAPPQDPPVVPHLNDDPHHGLDLRLTVTWNGVEVSHPPFASMYWTPAQQLAHMTSNGATLRTGDLFASGTVSGPQRGEVGSFLELTWGGTEPVELGAESRTFLLDGDTVVISATAPGADGGTIRLGEVSGTVLPAVI